MDRDDHNETGVIDDEQELKAEATADAAKPRHAGMAASFNNMSIGGRVSSMAGVLLLALLVVAGISVLNIRSIGEQIVGVAERDMPLTTRVVQVEVLQLEQTIEFERAIRFGEQMHASHHAAELFTETVDKFGKFSHEAEVAIAEAEALAKHAMETAHLPEDQHEFEEVLHELEAVEVAHASFEKHAIEVFKMLEAGLPLRQVEQAAESVEHEAAALNATLIEMEHRVADFTEAALLQAEADEKSTLLLVSVLGAVSLVVGVLASILIVRSITRPVASMTEAMGRLADNDLTVDIVGTNRGDEIGKMAAAVQVFKDNAIRAEQLEAEQRAEREAREQRARRIEELSSKFETTVTSVIGSLESSGTQMKSSSESMSATAEETNRQANAVAAASEQASTNVQTVAAASEQLASSVTVIGEQVEQSTKKTTKAVSEAEAANGTVQGLADAAQKIGEVVSLINDIASQTNLLALNATIEAARAGEAGKGFAVVASEVKTLASQTAKATEEISAQIVGIQQESTDTVTAIEGIRAVITDVNEVTSAIAAAVEEQGAATQEIARNVQEAATGTQEVSSNISGVTEAASETGQAANQVLTASEELVQQAATLRQEVETFLNGVKAA